MSECKHYKASRCIRIWENCENLEHLISRNRGSTDNNMFSSFRYSILEHYEENYDSSISSYFTSESMSWNKSKLIEWFDWYHRINQALSLADYFKPSTTPTVLQPWTMKATHKMHKSKKAATFDKNQYVIPNHSDY